MTVGELIKILQEKPKEAEVKIAPTWTTPAQSIKNVVRVSDDRVFLNYTGV